ncbi:MAG: AMP-binding protein, partial [Myxococcales bacterium]|nr:AMP-binding protein [Myxococcales bacterium]
VFAPHLRLPHADHALDALADAFARAPFDLRRPPLLRVILARLAGKRSGLILVWHHIATDAWSISTMLRALDDAYRSDGTEAAADAPPSYVAIMASRRMTAAQREAHRDWWRAHLADAEPLDLPLDHPRGARAPQGALHGFALDPSLSRAIDELARATGTSAFAVLATAWATVLRRQTGQAAPCVGVITSGRSEPGAEAAVGFFVETLPVHFVSSDTSSVADAIGEAHRRVQGALEHQHLPLGEILATAPSTGRESADAIEPLLRATLVLEDAAWASPRFADAPAVAIGESISGDVGDTAKFELSLVLIREADSYRGSLEFRADLFERSTVERLAAHLGMALVAMVEAPAQRLADVAVNPPAERALLAEWNDTARPFRDDACIHALFAEQVERTPDAIAAVFEDEEISYRALFTRANALAWHLRGLGVGPEVRVGICLEKSIDALVAILGVLGAGAAYVPLDPSHPPGRLRFMGDDAGLAFAIHAAATSPFACPTVQLPDVAPAGRGFPPSHVDPSNTAYVIYTSGSTGAPKGVVVPHRGLVNVVQDEVGRLCIGAPMAVLQFAALAFDTSASQLFGALATGARLVLPSAAQRGGRALLDLLARHAVDVADLPPAVLAGLDALPPEAPGLLIVGGEACP